LVQAHRTRNCWRTSSTPTSWSRSELAITNLNRSGVGGVGAKEYPVATFYGSYIGAVDELRDLLQPLQHSAKAFQAEIVEQEFWQAQIDWLSVPELSVHGLAQTARCTNQPLPAKVVDQLIRPAIWWQPSSSRGVRREMQGRFSDTVRFITPHCQPGAFQNWPYRGLPDALIQYYGSNFPRLTQVKKAYDPNNLFHYEQCVPMG
jgi:hypothetical protein